MQDDRVESVDVYRRIGGLENLLKYKSCIILVYRRIGGLEI